MFDNFEYDVMTVISSFFILYLPITDMATKLAISNALSRILSKILISFFGMVSHFKNIFKYFWKENYIIIKKDNPAYEKIIDYLYTKYFEMIAGCRLESDFGKNKMVIDKLNTKSISEKFTYDDKTYTIDINFVDDETIDLKNIKKSDNKVNIASATKNILISSSCTTKILEKFVLQLIRKSNEKVSNDLLIFKLTISDKKTRHIVWKEYSTKTSKNLDNTIVSNEVKETFYDDMKKFIESESFYAERGLPYKRGYILHGPPGCGKTSLIKAVANHYQLPIFILDLSVLVNNNELTTAVSEINGFVTSDEKYLLVMEDVDRTKMFKSRKNYYYEEDRKGITDDCLLNVLDGVDENYGRITIMTANDYEMLTSIKAMMRPGRIDMIVNVTYCSKDQIQNIIKFYFPNKEFNIDDGIEITPAKLIQVILIVNDIDRIVTILNKHKSFDDLTIEKILGFKNISVDGNADDNSSNDSSDDSSNSDDSENEDELGISWRERRIRRLAKKLQTQKSQLDLMEKQTEQQNEKEKLLLERKRIAVKLQELSLEEQKTKLNTMHKMKNNKVKFKDLGLDRINDIIAKNNEKGKKQIELIDDSDSNSDNDDNPDNDNHSDLPNLEKVLDNNSTNNPNSNVLEMSINGKIIKI